MMTSLIMSCFSRKLQIWSHLLKKSVMENFIFCAVLLFRDRKNIILYTVTLQVKTK